MILKRLANALRAQDWTTVTVEFFIVVAGIYLGLQANDWALDRENRKQERAALERLLLEAEGAVEAIEQRVQYTQWINGVRRASISFIDSDDAVPEDDLMLRVGINTLDRFPPLNPVRVAYQELTSAGQMQLIRAPAVRATIASFHAELETFNRFGEIFGSDRAGFWNGYKRHVTWDYNPESETSDVLLSAYNWQTMRADEDFILESIGKLRNQLVIEENLLALQELALQMCESIAREIGSECSPG